VNESSSSLARSFMPLLGLHCETALIEYWQAPYVRLIKSQIKELIKKLTEANL